MIKYRSKRLEDDTKDTIEGFRTFRYSVVISSCKDNCTVKCGTILGVKNDRVLKRKNTVESLTYLESTKRLCKRMPRWRSRGSHSVGLERRLIAPVGTLYVRVDKIQTSLFRTYDTLDLDSDTIDIFYFTVSNVSYRS